MFSPADYPYFILQLNDRGEIIKNLHCNNQSIFPDKAICQDFLALIDNGSMQKARLFLDEILSLGVALEWELSFRLKSSTEVFSVSGFKVNNIVFMLISGKVNGAQMMYEELSLINNEQLSSIRILRKQLNQMAAEYNQIRALLTAENEALKKEINALKLKQTLL